LKLAAWLALYAVTSTSGLVLLSTSLRDREFTSVIELAGRPVLWLGAVLYVASFGCWLYILSQERVSTAYPLAIGLSYTATLIASITLLGDRMPAIKLAGVILIGAGVLLIASATSS
jgi:multidrug transporter EmrE-like cation transporter